MALSSEALLAALRSATVSSYQAEETVMKLAKKNDRAVLRFDIIITNSIGRDAKVSHDVLVDVLKPHEVAKLVEPLCPEENASWSFIGWQVKSNNWISRRIFSFPHYINSALL